MTHDHNLKRVTGVNAEVSDLTYEELPPLLDEIHVTFSPKKPPMRADHLPGPHRIPLLTEVLDQFPDTPLNIDIKCNVDELIEKTAEILEERDGLDRVVIGNHSDAVNQKIRKRLPEVNSSSK